MHCEWVKTVWFASKLGVRFGYTNNVVMSLIEWLEQIICNEDDDVIQLVLSTCNQIWWIINKRCFEGSDIPCAVSCYNNALKLYTATIVQNFKFCRCKTNRYHFQTVTSDGVFRLQDPTNLMLTLWALRRMENGASQR